MPTTKLHKRLNITINQETWERLEKMVPRMERSQFIDHALRVYLTHLKRKALRNRLKEEAIANAEEDLKIADEWFTLDQETWDNIR